MTMKVLVTSTAALFLAMLGGCADPQKQADLHD
jgi:hypothetical protein